jgi:hypothetical protein
MGRRRRAGRPRWVISDWFEDVDGAEFWLTMLAVAGWGLLLAVLWE